MKNVENTRETIGRTGNHGKSIGYRKKLKGSERWEKCGSFLK